MTATNGWPGKPGVPLNPEKDGWHWLLANTNKGPQPEAAFWDSRCFAWFCQGIEELTRPEKMMNYGWLGYLGPCLTPDEAAKREDVKWHEGYAVGVLDVRRGTAFGETDTHYAALQKRIAELEAALKAAAEDIGDWGAYASQYLQEKWDLSGEVKRYTAISEGKLPYRARYSMEEPKDE